MAVLLVSTVIWIACTKDTVPVEMADCAEIPTYDTNMKALVDTYCAHSTCHNGTAEVPGDYTTYQGMKVHFEDGIADRVISRQDMPPSYSEGGPVALTPEDLKLFDCWISENFPEN